MDASIKTRRRWFSYSLRALLVATTIACCVLAWRASIAHERMHLLKMIRDRGGAIGMEYHLSGHPGNWTYTETQHFLLNAADYSTSEIERIQRAFPDDEVSLGTVDPDGDGAAPPPPPIPSVKPTGTAAASNHPDRGTIQ